MSGELTEHQMQKNETADSRNDETAFSISSPSELLRSFEEDEDTVEWINNVIDSAQTTTSNEPSYDLSELEKCVSQLSASLELICEDTSSQLERTIEEISRTVPRLSYDFQFISENVLSLQGALRSVDAQSKSSVGSHETLGVLDRLHYLDTVKRNMSDSLAVLKEAESWSSLEAEVVSYLSEHAYTQAASRLAEASRSLGVFQNTPDYENRKNLLISLQNQLEASLSSALVAGISSGDVELCRKYFDIFRHIDRESEFRSYWNGSKRKPVVSVWENTALRDCDEQVPSGEQVVTDVKFSAFLTTFFGELLNLTETERITITQVFPDPQMTLSAFICTTVTTLHPSFGRRLASVARRYDSLALVELIDAYKATQVFAVSMQKIMEKLGYSERSPLQSTVPLEDQDNSIQLQRSHSRRRSQRLSFSRRLGPKPLSVSNFGTNSLDNSWGEALFEPFVDLQCDYLRLEKKNMKEQLRRSSITGGPVSQGARALRERSVDLFATLDDAIHRCIAFTHGFGLVGLLQAIDDTVSEFLSSSKGELLDSNSAPLPESTGSTLGDDFAELDYSAEDYSSFQAMLHLLEVIRGISERLSVYATKLRVQVVQTASFIKNMRNDPQGFYLSGTIKPAIDLLQMSALNNVELQALIDSVDPDSFAPIVQTPTTPKIASLFSGQKGQNLYDNALIQGAHTAVSDIARACQLRLQETILAPLMKHLDEYAHSFAQASNNSSTSSRSGGLGVTNEIAIPRFSLSPSQTIQRVAEGLLNLPRLFEVYADDNALSFSIETLPHVNTEVIQQFLDHTDSADLHRDSRTDNRNRPRHLASPSLSLKSLSPPTVAKSLPPEVVSSAWLTSLAMSLLSHLTLTVLPSVKSLDSGGSAQLAEDINYLSQIVKALNVEWKPLELWREYIVLEEVECRAKLESVRSSGDTEAAATLLLIGKSRGWSF